MADIKNCNSYLYSKLKIDILLVKSFSLTFEEGVVFSVLLTFVVESFADIAPICTINIYGPSRQVLITAFIS